MIIEGAEFSLGDWDSEAEASNGNDKSGMTYLISSE